MQIHLRNEIDLDGEIEVIDQRFPVEVTIKNGQVYLVFINEEEEKVIIKCSQKELGMTRFSNPKSVMRFVAEEEAIVVLPTPLGLQHFVTETHQYHLDMDGQKLQLSYVLKPLGEDAAFAAYKMAISWG